MPIHLPFERTQEYYRALYEKAIERNKELYRLLVAIVYQNGGALTITEDTLVAFHEDAELEADGYELITRKGSLGGTGLVLRIKKKRTGFEM